MAMTGALVGSSCFTSQALAQDGYFSGLPPAINSSNNSVIQFVKTGSVWQQKVYDIQSNGTWSIRSTTTATVPTFPLCDPTANFMDGITVGWGIAAAVVVAFTFKLMQRAAG